jgi:hypothetical protein
MPQEEELETNKNNYWSELVESAYNDWIDSGTEINTYFEQV